MTDLKPDPDPKPRLSINRIPLLILCLVGIAGVVLVFVPMIECNFCQGVGQYTYRESFESYAQWQNMDQNEMVGPNPDLEHIFWRCKWCSGVSKVSPFRMWAMDMPERDPLGGRDQENGLRRIRELRESRP